MEISIDISKQPIIVEHELGVIRIADLLTCITVNLKSLDLKAVWMDVLHNTEHKHMRQQYQRPVCVNNNKDRYA